MYLKHIFKCICLEISIVAFLRIKSLSVSICVVCFSRNSLFGLVWSLSLLNQAAHSWVEHDISDIFYSEQHMQRYVLALLLGNLILVIYVKFCFSIIWLWFFPLQAVSIWEDAPGPCRRYALVHILLHSALFALASLYHGNSTVISLKL